MIYQRKKPLGEPDDFVFSLGTSALPRLLWWIRSVGILLLHWPGESHRHMQNRMLPKSGDGWPVDIHISVKKGIHIYIHTYIYIYIFKKQNNV